MDLLEFLILFSNIEVIMIFLFLGILYHSNDLKYDGEWKNDKKEGKGILII